MQDQLAQTKKHAQAAQTAVQSVPANLYNQASPGPAPMVSITSTSAFGRGCPGASGLSPNSQLAKRSIDQDSRLRQWTKADVSRSKTPGPLRGDRFRLYSTMRLHHQIDAPRDDVRGTAERRTRRSLCARAPDVARSGDDGHLTDFVVWRCTGSYDGAWRKSSRCNGRRSKSPAG